MDWAKTIARGDKKHLSFGIRCWLILEVLRLVLWLLVLFLNMILLQILHMAEQHIYNVIICKKFCEWPGLHLDENLTKVSIEFKLWTKIEVKCLSLWTHESKSQKSIL